ncbi:FAD binding domain-containing protein [Dactylonectria estremocensis]|uniref:FAD binding domain-containing protein n=1 Tax=Dactylonectria estremocensis TaxID=1079267 RepID=A0A9P9EXH1_9HYPO|nr:FAD binding domain-containing protein [Dactylonectria estremocensis]
MKAPNAAVVLALLSEGASATSLGRHSPSVTCVSNSALAPWCMVLPESASDVSSIVKVLTKNDCPFGMRSGAHSAWAGANSIADGVTVDFGYMNTTTYDDEAKIARIRPGSTWGHVLSSLDPYGVTAVGGRVSVVGYSFYSSREGFACDSVANFEVVLGDGSIINANAKKNSDLFRSLKGGSGNFGFITRVDQYVVESNTMWAARQVYNTTQKNELFDAYFNFANNQSEDDASQNMVSYIYNADGFNLVAVLSNIDSSPEAAAFDEYMSIEPILSLSRVDLVSNLVVKSTGPAALGVYTTWLVGMTAHNRRVMDLINQAQIEYVEKMKEAAPDSNFVLHVQFQPVTCSIVDHSIAKGSNVLSLEDIVADGPSIMWLVEFTVDTLETQEQILPLCLEFRDAINHIADENGAQKNWDFLNYANGDQGPISMYGAKNVAFLQSVSAKYDRRQVFQRLRKTDFKLPE